MAANRIKGITIEIDGNVTPLTSALKDVDKSLKDTQTQLKDVDRLLKLDPSNIDLLKQKHDLLASAIKDTKTRQEELKTALEQAQQAGSTEANQAQQQALQRELIATTQELAKLEEEYKKTSPTLESISAKTGELSEKTRGLSTAAGLAAGGMLVMAQQAGKNADDLLTMSQQTGFSVEELQKMKYAADLVDVSYETMTGSIAKLTKNMTDENTALQELGVEIKNEDGSMRDATEVWYDAVEALGQVENSTERDKLSMDIFGKSAMEMAGIVDDGGKKLKDMGQKAEDLGIIMSGQAVEDAGKFNDALDQLKNTAVQSFTSAGANLATTLIPTLEKLVEVVSKVLSWFANLDGTTQTVILTILGLVAAISPVLGLISTLTTLAGALNVAMLPMIGTMALIVAGIAAVVAIGVTLYKNWDTIKQKATDLWNKLKSVFESIKTGISDRVEAIKTKVTTVFENVKSAITTPIEKAKDFISGVVEKIKNFFSFKIELPKIKLPHFGITPKGWKLGDLLKGSIPKLGIEWYAKAMDEGMLLDRPTIFGTQNGKLLAGGEAGPEVVVGAHSLMDMIRSATGGGNGVVVNVTVNGNVDNYDEMAETIGQKLQQQMARQQRVWA